MARAQSKKELLDRHAQYSIAAESVIASIEHEPLSFRVVLSEIIESS
jgi:hypothetical protein